MNKIKLLSILVGLLVALNIVVLSFMFMGKKHKRHAPDGPRPIERHEMIKEKFGFNDDQITLFDISRNRHVELSKTLTEELKIASMAYYKVSATEAIKDSLYSTIAMISKKIYTANDNHFDDVRKICTADQIPKMDNFIKDLMTLRGPKGRKGKRRR